MLKQVIFWCGVFVALVVSAVLLGGGGSERQAPKVPAQLPPLSTASATEQCGVADRLTSRPEPNIAKAAGPERRSDP